MVIALALQTALAAVALIVGLVAWGTALAGTLARATGGADDAATGPRARPATSRRSPARR